MVRDIDGTGDRQAVRHRNDIDGLRALAVAPIVLFHAGLSQMSGGFVGVDIFFVISGYLITAIIVRELDGGHFSLLEFYRRRVVRIVPALVATLVGTLLAGCLLMLPRELQSLGKSGAGAALFASNIYFWKTTDYFTSSAETMPLLHTWSLGVEEQFYLFYPLALVALRRWAPRLTVPVLVILAMLSFGADIRWSLRGSTTGFYMFPGRIWELVMGGLLALHGTFDLPKWGRQILAAAGTGMLVAGLLVIRSDSLFPAPMGLLPCGGAALLIACGEGTLVGRGLSLTPVRWIGLISYSLYLWHWPIMAFMRLQWGLHLSPVLVILAIVASVTAGALSYYLVETPTRRLARRRRPLPMVIAGLCALALTAALSLAIVRNADRLVPLNPVIARVAAFADYYGTPAYVAQQRPHTCFAHFDDQSYDRRVCLAWRARGPNVLLVGDSHAAQYWLPLVRRFPEANVMQATSSGCLPQFQPVGAPWCVPVIDGALRFADASGKVDAVVLAARWMPEQLPALLSSVRRLAARGIPVTVIGPINEYDGDFPVILARAMLRHDLGRVAGLREDGPMQLDHHMAPLVRAAGGTYYSVMDQECPAGHCRLFASDGTPFHTDYGHVAERGGEDLMARLPAPWQGGRRSR